MEYDIVLPEGDPDMRTMGAALLLLLATAICTAASVEDRARRSVDPMGMGAEACLVYKGESYRGNLATTVTGKTCQRWASQDPHSHKFRPDKYEKYGLDKNYCRSPSSTASLWCYTTDLGKRWEICNVPGCNCAVYKGTLYRGTIAVTKSGKACQPWASQTPHTHKFKPVSYLKYGLDQNYCRNPSGASGPWCYTTDPGERWDYCDVPGCECLEGSGGTYRQCLEGSGSTYRGKVAVTATGRTCQRWDSRSPHKPSYKPPDGTDHNYCRNPSRHTTAWCYTTDPAKRWENCAIPGCECRMGNGKSYRGTVSVTATGRTCQRWDVKTPHKPSYKPPDGTDHNYCRNPSRHTTAWCYTTDPAKRWENCDVPGCGDGIGAAELQSTHFTVVNIRKTAAEAKAHCGTLGGHLADVKSRRVHDYLMKVIQEHGSTAEDYRVGLHDSTGSGGWKWADGTSLSSCSYQNWAPGEPNNIGSAQCVQMLASSSPTYSWNTDQCDNSQRFICQTGPGDHEACGRLSGREIEEDADISRELEMSVSWEEEELEEELREAEEEAGPEAEVEDAILDDLDAVLEELRDVVEEKIMMMEK
ncbi:plasminogen-like [Branchiostoma floridae x Branchiostoma belcheri]